MFRDDKQRGLVCAILCAWIPRTPWQLTETGYRPEGVLKPRGVSSSERAMINLAYALWRGEDLVVYTGFDRTRSTDIGQLLVAMAYGTIDQWCTERMGRLRVKVPVPPFYGSLGEAEDVRDRLVEKRARVGVLSDSEVVRLDSALAKIERRS